jgi:hypothetical protein
LTGDRCWDEFGQLADHA